MVDIKRTVSTPASPTSSASLLVSPMTPLGLPRSVSKRFEARTSEEHLVLNSLLKVVDPCSIATGVPISISDMGLVREIVVENGTATVKLRLTNPFCFQIGIICDEVEKKVRALGLDCVIDVDPNDDWSSDLMSLDAQERLRQRRQRPLPLSALKKPQRGADTLSGQGL
jgi:metal-sulfur cluster biosynthetic enzyme